MKLAFWSIVKAYNMTEYTEALNALEELNPAAATAFRGYKPEVFCRAFMTSEVKSDAVTNNMAETFNGYIIHARTRASHLHVRKHQISLDEKACGQKKRS